MATHIAPTVDGEIPKPQTKQIWVVFWILFGITALEFLIAFTVPAGTLRTIVFVLMTIVKAFYIVAHFMHLKGEVKALAWSIVLPMVFVLWLIGALLKEASALFEVRF